MARYVDVEDFPKLFDAEYKKTIELIEQGETHLDNLAEGFLEADRVIRNLPTADVAPRAEVAREIFEEIDKRLDDITVIASPNDCFITTFRKTMEKVTAEIEELKKKYTEGEK